MGTAFFEGWALWEKMTFVLGCAIVVTIALGCFKLWHNNWRIRKYTSLELAQKGKAHAMVETQLEAGTLQPNKTEADPIPFGIRALQSGVEIDGVWISQANSPAPSSPASTASFMPAARARHLSSLPDTSHIPRLDLPPTVHRARARGAGTRARTVPSFDRAVEAEGNTHNRDSPVRSSVETFNRRTGPPLAFTRHAAHVSRHSGVVSAYESLDSGSGSAIGSMYSAVSSRDPSPNNSRPQSHDSDSMTVLLNAGTDITDALLIDTSRRSDPRAGFDLLQSHRLSHVAETGQLTPRTRRAITSVDLPGTASSNWTHDKTVSVDIASSSTYGYAPRSVSDTFPTSRSHQGSVEAGRDHYSTPIIESTSPHTRISQWGSSPSDDDNKTATDSAPDPHHRHARTLQPSEEEAIQRAVRELDRLYGRSATAAPDSTPHESDADADADTDDDLAKAKQDAQSVTRQSDTVSKGSSSGRSDEKKPKERREDQHRPRSFHALRDSRVLRKVNSGFQILRPGSLAMGASGAGCEPEKEALVPASAAAVGGDGDGRSKKRKLQKKTRLKKREEKPAKMEKARKPSVASSGGWRMSAAWRRSGSESVDLGRGGPEVV